MDTLLSSGSGAAVSAEVTLAAGAVATLVLTGKGHATIEVKGLENVFVPAWELQGSAKNRAVMQVSGPCTFRVRRKAQGNSVAVGCEEG